MKNYSAESPLCWFSEGAEQVTILASPLRIKTPWGLCICTFNRPADYGHGTFATSGTTASGMSFIMQNGHSCRM